MAGPHDLSVQWRPHVADSYPRPKFVMFGIDDDLHGGVILFASRELDLAELKSQVLGLEKEYFAGLGLFRLEKRRTTLHVEMKKFTMIRAETYTEALASLLTTWRPPEPG